MKTEFAFPIDFDGDVAFPGVAGVLRKTKHPAVIERYLRLPLGIKMNPDRIARHRVEVAGKRSKQPGHIRRATGRTEPARTNMLPLIRKRVLIKVRPPIERHARQNCVVKLELDEVGIASVC